MDNKLERITLNKAMQQQYTPSQNQYSNLTNALNGIAKVYGAGDIAISSIENALSHAYMCGFTTGKKQENKELMAELEKPMV